MDIYKLFSEEKISFHYFTHINFLRYEIVGHSEQDHFLLLAIKTKKQIVSFSPVSNASIAAFYQPRFALMKLLSDAIEPANSIMLRERSDFHWSDSKRFLMNFRSLSYDKESVPYWWIIIEIFVDTCTPSWDDLYNRWFCALNVLWDEHKLVM